MADYETKMKVAKIYAASSMIPEELRNKPADVLMLLDLAESIGEPFWRVATGMRVFQGKLTPTAEFMIGRAMSSGRFSGSFSYEEQGEGEDLSVRVTAVNAGTGREIRGPWVSMKMAKAEGWTRNRKYGNPEMARHMLRLRAATFFIRLHCPDVMFGGMVAEELEDVGKAKSLLGGAPFQPATNERIQPKVDAKVLAEDAQEDEEAEDAGA